MNPKLSTEESEELNLLLDEISLLEDYGNIWHHISHMRGNFNLIASNTYQNKEECMYAQMERDMANLILSLKKEKIPEFLHGHRFNTIQKLNSFYIKTFGTKIKFPQKGINYYDQYLWLVNPKNNNKIILYFSTIIGLFIFQLAFHLYGLKEAIAGCAGAFALLVKVKLILHTIIINPLTKFFHKKSLGDFWF